MPPQQPPQQLNLSFTFSGPALPGVTHEIAVSVSTKEASDNRAVSGGANDGVVVEGGNNGVVNDGDASVNAPAPVNGIPTLNSTASAPPPDSERLNVGTANNINFDDSASSVPPSYVSNTHSPEMEYFMLEFSDEELANIDLDGLDTGPVEASARLASNAATHHTTARSCPSGGPSTEIHEPGTANHLSYKHSSNPPTTPASRAEKRFYVILNGLQIGAFHTAWNDIERFVIDPTTNSLYPGARWRVANSFGSAERRFAIAVGHGSAGLLQRTW